jgi:hypothetical protein
VAECDEHLVPDVAAAQIGGDVDWCKAFRDLEQVVVVGEDLLFGHGHRPTGHDGDLAGHLGEHRLDQSTGQAVGLEEDHRPP